MLGSPYTTPSPSRGVGPEGGRVDRVLSSSASPGPYILSLEEALELLPEEEKKRYEECRDSVIEARRSANRVEGQLWL